jgi:hypothetical protein
MISSSNRDVKLSPEEAFVGLAVSQKEQQRRNREQQKQVHRSCPEKLLKNWILAHGDNSTMLSSSSRDSEPVT